MQLATHVPFPLLRPTCTRLAAELCQFAPDCRYLGCDVYGGIEHVEAITDCLMYAWTPATLSEMAFK